MTRLGKGGSERGGRPLNAQCYVGDRDIPVLQMRKQSCREAKQQGWDSGRPTPGPQSLLFGVLCSPGITSPGWKLREHRPFETLNNLAPTNPQIPKFTINHIIWLKISMTLPPLFLLSSRAISIPLPADLYPFVKYPN